MNERIQELAKHAGFQYIKDEGIGWAGNHNASLPKFAELIVKECIGIVENLAPGYADYRSQIEDAFRVDCVATIKRKFGVDYEKQEGI